MGIKHSGFFPWDEQADAMLRTLASQQKTALEIAAAIAAEFGAPLSRNSVIGRARRIRVALISRSRPSQARPQPSAPPLVTREPSPPPAVQRTAQSEGVRLNKAPIAGQGGVAQASNGTRSEQFVTRSAGIPATTPSPAADDEREPVSLIERSTFQCAYIVSRPAVVPAMCCGRPVRGLTSWCVAHTRRVYQKAVVEALGL